MAFNVNGHEYSYASLRTSVGKLRGDYVSSIDYDDGLDGAVVKDGDGLPVGATKGEYEATASIEFHTRSHYQEFVDSLGDAPYEQFFTLTCSYSEKNISPVITDTIPRCRIKKPSVSAAKGSNEAIPVKVELLVAGIILWNGKSSVSKRV
jgi:hypothetical protein